MYKNYVTLLQHILAECEYLSSVITSDTTKQDIVDDETLKRAVVRSLEIIGEATKKIPADVKIKWGNYFMEKYGRHARPLDS